MDISRKRRRRKRLAVRVLNASDVSLISNKSAKRVVSNSMRTLMTNNRRMALTVNLIKTELANTKEHAMEVDQMNIRLRMKLGSCLSRIKRYKSKLAASQMQCLGPISNNANVADPQKLFENIHDLVLEEYSSVISAALSFNEGIGDKIFRSLQELFQAQAQNSASFSTNTTERPKSSISSVSSASGAGSSKGGSFSGDDTGDEDSIILSPPSSSIAPLVVRKLDSRPMPKCSTNPDLEILEEEDEEEEEEEEQEKEEEQVEERNEMRDTEELIDEGEGEEMESSKENSIDKSFSLLPRKSSNESSNSSSSLGRRPRRSRAQVSYCELKVNKKMRQGDPGTFGKASPSKKRRSHVRKKGFTKKQKKN